MTGKFAGKDLAENRAGDSARGAIAGSIISD
jgi:hypothetical protein